MKAIIIRGTEAKVEDHPQPKLRPGYLLVKPVAIALNPTDWKHIDTDRAAKPWGTSGCDFAGYVEEVGPGVTKQWKKGDAIMGVAHGANFSQPEDGVFAEYAVVKGDVQMRKPAHLEFEQATTLPLGSMTVGQGLYEGGLGLNMPTNPITTKEFVLIYGGSTATGSLGIQFAKLSGYTVITTASPRNHDFCIDHGASEVFDYNDPECAAKIRKYTDNKLKYAWDCIGLESSAKICAEALSSEAGCHYGSVLPTKLPREGVKETPRFMYSMFGERFEKAGKEFPASMEDYGFGILFMALTERLVHDGKIIPHPEKVEKGGLQGALEGMQHMREGKVSRSKLVYRVAETT